MRIESGNPYYYVDRTLRQQPGKIKVEVTPLAAARPQPAAESAKTFNNSNETGCGQINQPAEISGEQLEAEKEKLKILLTCMEIARRISGGDKVPPEDHKFLMEHDFALYARSILQRFPKSNPHAYKRLSKDDESKNVLKGRFSDAIESCNTLKSVLAQGIDIALDSNAGGAV